MKTIRVENGTRDAVLGERVHVADGWWTRLRGLLGRAPLEPGEGLLIVPSKGVHMYGMKYAIDVLLLDRGRHVLAAFQELQPGKRTPLFKRAHYALELPARTIDRSGTREGDVLRW